MVDRRFEPGLVTIAITTHNRGELLERALCGAQVQTYRRIEILVSDDASTDDTRERMKRVRDPRVRYLRLEHPTGIAGNFQNALDHASGELFLILNDDDELEPEAVEKLAGAFWSPPAGTSSDQVVLSWCPCKIQDSERRVRYLTDSGPLVESGIDLVTGLFDGTRGPRFCGILMRTSLAAEIGFSAEHGGIPDVGIWTRMLVRGGVACCINAPLARYTAHQTSCTGKSSAESWQRAGEAIVRDLLRDLQDQPEKQTRIRKSQKNFITELLATVLIQSMGSAGWKQGVLKELYRAPQFFFTPLTLKRLLLDGGKLLRRRH